ncbi:hypothetical protein HDU97_010292 [Phlyctochytrium planicorne]|nr:hypothetical protein HDU97_010292 [Phlyctochytrium planicorne]
MGGEDDEEVEKDVETMEEMLFPVFGGTGGGEPRDRGVGDCGGDSVCAVILEPLAAKFGAAASYLLVIAFAFFVFAYMFLALIVFRGYLFSEFSTGLWPLRVLRVQINVIHAILFIPSTYTFLNIFRCRFTDCDSMVIQNLLRFLAAVGLICDGSVTYLLSFTHHQPNPISESPIGKPEVLISVLDITHQLVVVLTVVFAYSGELELVKSAIYVGCAVSVLIYQFMFIPFYNKIFGIIRCCLTTQLCWVGLWALVQTVNTTVHPNHSDEIQDYIWYFYLCGIPVIGVASFFVIWPRYTYATSYAVAARHFANGSDGFGEHPLDTDLDTVKSKKEIRFWHPSQVELSTRFLMMNNDEKAVSLADQLYINGLNKFPNNSWLMLQYAMFCAAYKHDKTLATTFLKRVKPNVCEVNLEVLVYLIQQDMKNANYSKTVGNKILDVVDRVEFKQLMKNATVYHKEAKANIANFWQTIMMAEEDKPVDTSVLIGLVAQMERSDERAHEAYKLLMNRFPLSVQVLEKYTVFLDEIHNNKTEATEVQKRIKKIEEAGLSDVEDRQVDGKSITPIKNKKERQAYKDYRKQVYMYSRANSWVLSMLIRGVIFVFSLVAVSQLLIIHIGMDVVHKEFVWLKNIAACQNVFPAVHSSLRTLQVKSYSLQNLDVANLVTDVLADLEDLHTNSDVIFDKLSDRRATYLMWGVPRVVVDIFHGTQVNPNRTLVTLTLRDGILTYLRHAKTILQQIGPGIFLEPNSRDFLTTEVNWRFLQDNGIVILADAFSDLAAVHADNIRLDLRLLAFLQLGAWAVGILVILLIAFCVFLPTINKAKRERETSLRAFLQIPKNVTQVLFRRYYDSNTMSFEDLKSSHGSLSKQSSGAEMEGESVDDDDDDPTGGDVDVLHTKAASGYVKLTLMYSRALFIVAASFSIALACNMTLTYGLIAYPGTMVSGLDAQFRARRVKAVASDRLQDVFPSLNSYIPGIVSSTGAFKLNDTERPWVSAVNVIGKDLENLNVDQRNILYGNESLGIPFAPMDAEYQPIFFSDGTGGENADSLYNLIASFVDASMRVSMTEVSNASLVTKDYRLIQTSIGTLVTGFQEFVDAFQGHSEDSITRLMQVSIGMFVLVMITIIGTYFLYFRQIQSYLINTENERTLKLLLMIPVEIVADIDSLRELLHLKQKKKILNPKENEKFGSTHGHGSAIGSANIRNQHRTESELSFAPHGHNPGHNPHHRSNFPHPGNLMPVIPQRQHADHENISQGDLLDNPAATRSTNGGALPGDEHNAGPIPEPNSTTTSSYRRRSSMVTGAGAGQSNSTRRSVAVPGSEFKARITPHIPIAESMQKSFSFAADDVVEVP